MIARAASLQLRIGWVAAFCSCIGCAPVVRQAALWPAPPAIARVRFVRTLGGAADLESAWGRFWRQLSGAPSGAHVYHPVALAVTRDGSLLFVSDQALASVVSFDLANNTVKSTQSGLFEGTPVGITLGADERLYVVVSDRRVVVVLTQDLVVERIIPLAEVDRPTGIAVDTDKGELFVSDTSRTDGEGHCVRVYDMKGAVLRTLGSRGSAPGEYLFPTFVALSEGALYVADTLNARVQKVNRETGEVISVIGARGDRPGYFDKPKGVAFDAFGNVYVVDSFWSNVQIFNASGDLLLFFAGRGDSEGFLSNPAGIAIDQSNRIYVTNPLNFRVEVYQLINTTAADSAPPAPPSSAPTEEGRK